MLADILTKPLQGTKFKKMRAVLMNCNINYSEEETLHTAPLPIKSSPTNSPMKPRIKKIMPSPRECVEASPTQLTACTKIKTLLQVPLSPSKIVVMWKDALFPLASTPLTSTPLTSTHGHREGKLHRVLPFSE
jgi:hypothetical protein